jgi:hypothetical protein
VSICRPFALQQQTFDSRSPTVINDQAPRPTLENNTGLTTRQHTRWCPRPMRGTARSRASAQGRPKAEGLVTFPWWPGYVWDTHDATKGSGDPQKRQNFGRLAESPRLHQSPLLHCTGPVFGSSPRKIWCCTVAVCRKGRLLHPPRKLKSSSVNKLHCATFSSTNWRLERVGDDLDWRTAS